MTNTCMQRVLYKESTSFCQSSGLAGTNCVPFCFVYLFQRLLLPINSEYITPTPAKLSLCSVAVMSSLTYLVSLSSGLFNVLKPLVINTGLMISMVGVRNCDLAKGIFISYFAKSK